MCFRTQLVPNPSPASGAGLQEPPPLLQLQPFLRTLAAGDDVLDQKAVSGVGPFLVSVFSEHGDVGDLEKPV